MFLQDTRKRRRGSDATGITPRTNTSLTQTRAATTRDIVGRFSGIPNNDAICWFIALCQALAASFWVLGLAASFRPSSSPRPGPGDALLEMIQRCCNGRDLRPAENGAPFPVTGRAPVTLARACVKPSDGDVCEDATDGLMRALQQRDGSPFDPVFGRLSFADVRWFIVPHNSDCRDNRGRLVFRAAHEPFVSRSTSYPPVFIISPDHVRAASALPDFGTGSYFSDSVGAHDNSLIRYLNSTLLEPDVSDVCDHCAASFRLVSRRRFITVPDVLVIGLQKVGSKSPLVVFPDLLRLNNWGEFGSVNAYESYRLVSVWYYHSRPIRHFTARVRASIDGKECWLDCDDMVISATDGPVLHAPKGSSSFVAGFVYDRIPEGAGSGARTTESSASG